MIDIPLGKALVPVESKDGCDGCYFTKGNICYCPSQITCGKHTRQDGEDVIFDLVDYPVKEDVGNGI